PRRPVPLSRQHAQQRCADSGHPLRFRWQRRVRGHPKRPAARPQNVATWKNMPQVTPLQRRVVGMSGTLRLAAWLAFAAGAGAPRHAAGAPAPALAQDSHAPLELATFPRTSLEITRLDEHRAARKYAFEVWVADTPARA